jgi:thiol-disulfide isomerase/thioredoxin
MSLPFDDLTVACLCAESYCGTCREYRGGFEGLAEHFPKVKFVWLDIEDEAESLGNLDIENFPTILARRREWVLFFGVMLPQIGRLRRLIEIFLEQTDEQSRDYAFSSPERIAWQTNPDIRGLCRVV